MPLGCQVQKLVIAPLGILGREVRKHPCFPDLTRDHIVPGVVTVVNRAIARLISFLHRVTRNAKSPEPALTQCKAFYEITTSTLPRISLIVGTLSSWHNVRALADCGAERCLGEESGLHGLFGDDFYSHREPATQRARRLPDVCLRAPPFPRS